MIDELSAWLLLLKAPSLGIRTLYQALKYFETPQNILTSTQSMRLQSKVFKKATLDWIENANPKLIAADLDWKKQDNCHILTISDKDYPQQLLNITDPPPILYICGDTTILNNSQIAVVGSRNPTPAGVAASKEFSEQLSKQGLIITSGLASGIDANAHIGAISAGGNTIAVCGTSLDRVYPSKHKNLAHQISQCGALVSEFSISTPPIANNFPKRNRIITGMALGVLVVEAQTNSGSLVSARLANEQGREVFAIPSSIYNNQAKGCHQLIKQGAGLVENIQDILTNIDFKKANSVPTNNLAREKMQKNPQTDNILLKYLSYKPCTIDELAQQSSLNITQISEQLLSLELSGQVHCLADGRFVLG